MGSRGRAAPLGSDGHEEGRGDGVLDFLWDSGITILRWLGFFAPVGNATFLGIAVNEMKNIEDEELEQDYQEEEGLALREEGEEERQEGEEDEEEEEEGEYLEGEEEVEEVEEEEEDEREETEYMVEEDEEDQPQQEYGRIQDV